MCFQKNSWQNWWKSQKTKTFEKGAHVYERGARADHIFVVINGLVSLNRFEPGDKIGIPFEKRERGELFGTACFMKPQKYTLTGVCMEDSEVLAIDADKLLKLCETDPDLGYKFLKEVAKVYFERYKIAKMQIHAMVKTPTIITALPG